MQWRTRSIVAFDTETTGLFPENGDRVIEFAGVELQLAPDGSVAQAVPHHYMFNPQMPIPREATDVSGIRDEDVASAPLFSVHAGAIRELLANAVTIAHNYPFDQRFLTMELAKCELKWASPPVEIDTVDLSRRFFPEAKSHKLGELAKRLEVTLVGAHRATNDAEACGRAFLEMARRFSAPADVEALIDWADAIGDPPAGAEIARSPERQLVFRGGRYDGHPLEEHPDELAWMQYARERRAGRWEWRFSEGMRRWAERWLRIRASGRAAQNTKGFGAADWGIDPPVGVALGSVL